ncbi:hypothetical protein CEY16_02925 [Halalkalibacillus sediminis]|uniref:Diacylglyceryl transferase n=1 Tax=Halalkalibacillus sediminis TaxID=2018042 RepID=A0A2I0QWJ8_9BACI|nr:hypothetical protein [Halalkalibacillus sediminis]PKR78726.1 hypothetical protein CEY16_02925 [Halalkalibacillus sediminis]
MLGMWQLGPFNIYIPHLIIIFSILISGFLASGLAKRHQLSITPKQAFDLITEAWIVFFIVWKLSYFFYHPADLAENPIVILYFFGGEWGMLLAGVSAGIYSYFHAKKYGLPLTDNLILVLTSGVFIKSIDVLIDYNQLKEYIFLIEGFIYISVLVYFAVFNRYTLIMFFRLLRWILIVWVIFRVATEELQLYFEWTIFAIIVSLILLFSEWKFGKEKV